jgi:dihydrolipoamide dehydrogenase
VDFLIKKNKIERIKGFGKLKIKTEIEIFDDEGKSIDSITADNIILATGLDQKLFPQVLLIGNIITSTEAMVLKEQPKELIIIGAGAIGVEFAYFYNVLGTKVTIIEMLDRLVPVEDKEVSDVLEKSFKKRGMEIYTKTIVDKAEVKNGKVHVSITKDGQTKELTADKVLNAIGIPEMLKALGLRI